MLPVHDRPCVQWLVEELHEAGIDEIIFVYSKGQEMVEEFFTKKTWYDDELNNRGHSPHAEALEKIRNLAKFHFIEQQEQLGDGHAVLQAKHLIDEQEPVFVIFGDCLYTDDEVLNKMRDLYDKQQRSIVAVQEIPQEESHRYGIVEKGEGNDSPLPRGDVTSESALSGMTERSGGNSFIIQSMVEKPPSHQAPSNLAIIGRYLLSPSIWPHIEKGSSVSGEARIIDALQSLQQKEDIHGLHLQGQWLDTGTLEGLQRAGEVLKNA